MKYNPFKPGSIVHTGMFAGRYHELVTLERALFQTSKGNPAHFLIHGERGIGKSSLLLYVNSMATGDIDSINDQRFRFLTVNVELEPNDDYSEIISKVARELQRELDRSEALKKLLKDTWKFITSWNVLGVEYKRDAAPPTKAMLEELVDKLVTISRNLNDEYSGVFIFIDEADKPPSSAGLGEFVKVFTERLTKRGTTNVGLGVIGISTVIRRMRDSHESSVRVLLPVELAPLAAEDRKAVVDRGLAEASVKNAETVTIDESALTMIAELSEGYPHFIQQYAYSAFDEDTDNRISDVDVRRALTKDNGALQLLGQRYFENMYTDELRSDDYRLVLQVLAKHMPGYVTRKQIAAETKLKAHTVNNALTACTKHGSAIARKGHVGQFRLPSNSFATWILAFKNVQSLE